MGTELQLECLSSIVSNRNKWKIEMQSATPLEGQQMDMWCWAASARMFVNHYSAVPSERTQIAAVTAVKGSIVNEGVTAGVMIPTARYYTSGYKDYSEREYVGDTAKIYSEATLRRFLNDGHVVLIARGSYNPNGIREIGHASVIAGYTMTFNNGNAQNKYIIYDPYPETEPANWESPQITNGHIKVRSYQWICNGQNAVEQSNRDDFRWETAVVVYTSYSGDTIDFQLN